jgi:hypothetical protein
MKRMYFFLFKDGLIFFYVFLLNSKSAGRLASKSNIVRSLNEHFDRVLYVNLDIILLFYPGFLNFIFLIIILIN